TRPVTEVAQCYVHDVAADVVQPVRKLVAFRRVTLAPGETQTVRFDIAADALSHLDRQLRRVAGTGAFDVWVAPSARAGNAVRVQV
ncbi:MAG TPA: fibronectin type III-like domain-contianing protein, partial [Novosphingobium sp.]|nr:fibronectin type III-like domain-contianing protein [Novosphingobium sp.]